jgi:adenylosuccinate synthase
VSKAIITVGLGFGDEGKGATVDYLTRQFNADLVVRYCGGAQAGHWVRTPDGKEHCFSQFGAGMLAGAKTYLGPEVIIEPLAMRAEAAHLQAMGILTPYTWLYVHPDALVATPYHMALNRLRELARGSRRHGSCGLGIGETRSHALSRPDEAIRAAELPRCGELQPKLRAIQAYCVAEAGKLEDLPGGDVPAEFARYLLRKDPSEIAEELSEAFRARISRTVPEFDTVIFEGSQGVLLDEYKGFDPYTTWSTVTLKHATELLSTLHVTASCRLGITRAYTTRHGPGPLPGEYDAVSYPDPGNIPDDWRGRLRCGALNLALLRYALASLEQPLDGLVVNCLDQDDYFGVVDQDAVNPADLSVGVVRDRGSHSAEELCAMLTLYVAPVIITGRGPSANDRTMKLLPWRTARKGDL